MGLLELIGGVKHKAAKPSVFVRIPANRVADATGSPLAVFEPGQCYLEVRLAQMHLRDKREWWREFLPLASVITEFQSEHQRRAMPFLVGASTLGDQLLSDVGQVNLVNKRVAGPVPYLGDQIRLFVALYRTVYQDWAERALSFLEIVAKQVDVTRLSSVVSLAPAIVDGLEGLLNMKQVEIRLGDDREFVPGGDNAGDNALRPGWMVSFGVGPSPTPEQRLRLHVRNDRLHIADEQGHLAEFLDADFMLLNLRALDARDDYETFDFHKIFWARVQDRLWSYELEAAQTALGACTAALMQCTDLTRVQRANLLAHYQQMFREDTQLVRQVHDGTSHLDSVARPRQLSGPDLARLATSGPAKQVVGADIERLLAAFSE